MAQYLNKTEVMAEIDRRIQFFTKESRSSNSDIVIALYGLKFFLDALKAKEVGAWHLQKNEDIYDAVKDWSLHSFVCLMDDGSVQKFTGIRCECADGSINTHIDAIDDSYDDVDRIIFWTETPNLK